MKKRVEQRLQFSEYVGRVLGRTENGQERQNWLFERIARPDLCSEPFEWESISVLDDVKRTERAGGRTAHSQGER